MVNSLFEPQAPAVHAVPLFFADWDQLQNAARTDAAPTDTFADRALIAEAELQERLDEARRLGADEAERMLRDECAAEIHRAVETERTAVAHLCTAFSRGRDRYFTEVESKVVQLALGIAAKVLQRETSMDPLLLAGVARAALSKLAGVEGAVLHVPSALEDRWRRELKMAGVRVQADATLQETDLRITSSAGCADLGVQAQLAEIERGFFDLLARRPA